MIWDAPVTTHWSIFNHCVTFPVFCCSGVVMTHNLSTKSVIVMMTSLKLQEITRFWKYGLGQYNGNVAVLVV
jgi:hypothetical protein